MSRIVQYQSQPIGFRARVCIKDGPEITGDITITGDWVLIDMTERIAERREELEKARKILAEQQASDNKPLAKWNEYYALLGVQGIENDIRYLSAIKMRWYPGSTIDHIDELEVESDVEAP